MLGECVRRVARATPTGKTTSHVKTSNTYGALPVTELTYLQVAKRGPRAVALRHDGAKKAPERRVSDTRGCVGTCQEGASGVARGRRSRVGTCRERAHVVLELVELDRARLVGVDRLEAVAQRLRVRKGGKKGW